MRVDLYFKDITSQSVSILIEMSRIESIEAAVTGTARWSGGVFSYTVYKVEVYVNKNQTTWSVYRRYSAFAIFHEALQLEYTPELLQVKHITLPPKEKVGTLGSNLESIVAKRKYALQQFLSSVLVLDNIQQSSAAMKFFDTQHKGCSKCRLELGLSAIVRETFAKIKHVPVNHLSAMHLWKRYFIVLGNGGSFYVLGSLYDSVSEALFRLTMTAMFITITSEFNRNLIDIWNRQDDSHLYIKLSSTEEYGNWLRSLTDSISTGSPVLNPYRPVQKTEAKEIHIRVENIYDKGTGATEDEVSSLYGI